MDIIWFSLNIFFPSLIFTVSLYIISNFFSDNEEIPKKDTCTEKYEHLSERGYNNARVGYQAAIDLWGNLNQDHWSRFNAMVLANSIIVGMLGLILSNEETDLSLFALIISLAGLALTFFWYFFMARDIKLTRFYASEARDLEYKYLWPARTVYEGHDLVNNRLVNVGGESFNLAWDEKIRTRNLIKAVVYLFIFIYILFIFFFHFFQII